MTYAHPNPDPGTLRVRPAARVLALALLAASAACAVDEPMGPTRGAPDRPSLALNPACDPWLGGQTHADSVLTPETWNRANNPHRVNQPIYIHGAGVLTLQPGVLVCFGTASGLAALGGGRLVANGLDTARIVLTAADADSGWWGVHMAGTPSAGSSLRNVRLEHTRTYYALSTSEGHAAALDSVVIRQAEHGVSLWGTGTSLRRSRVDTVASAFLPAVALGNGVTFENSTIRGAAGVGVAVLGTSGVSLLGGRIEGSGGVGLRATAIAGPGFTATQPVRVTGGASYPAELSVGAFSKIYTQTSHQDSLLGNARDTLVVAGGALTWLGIASSTIPWHVTGNITVQGWGGLNALPGAVLAFDPGVSITAVSGGRVVVRGTGAAPVRFTGSAWYGIELRDSPSLDSYFSNARIEGVQGVAVVARNAHRVFIDSTVFRQNGGAAWLYSPGSRISRSRVDTTTNTGGTAVLLADSTSLQSTLIRGSAERGLIVTSSSATVQGCEIRDSAAQGIDLWDDGIRVHDCNLVNNGADGIRALSTFTADAENNWWGDAAGPLGPGGDGVSGAVDYTPWRTTPYVLPYVP